jgi:hypothetical protein
MIGEDASGTEFLETDFWMPVKVTAHGDHGRCERPDFFVKIHGKSLTLRLEGSSECWV